MKTRKNSSNSKPCLKKSKYEVRRGVCSDLTANLSYVMNEVLLEIWDLLLDCSHINSSSRSAFAGRIVSIESKSKKRSEDKSTKGSKKNNSHDRGPQRQRVTWAPSLDSVESGDDIGRASEESKPSQHVLMKRSEKRDETTNNARSNVDIRSSEKPQLVKSKTPAPSSGISSSKNSKEEVWQNQKTKSNVSAINVSATSNKGTKIEEDPLKSVARKAQKHQMLAVNSSAKKSENVLESSATSKKQTTSDEPTNVKNEIVKQHEISVVKQRPDESKKKPFSLAKEAKIGLQPKIPQKLWLI